MVLNYNKDNAMYLYNYYISEGFTVHGTIGLLANIYAESGFKPNNAQNSGNARLGVTDEEYTTNVDNGTYTNFIKDQIGYGICQWTYWSRKQNMLNYAKSMGKSIGDMEVNAGFLYWELSNGYKSVFNFLKKATSVEEAAKYVMLNFEKPNNKSVNNQNLRAKYALQLYQDLVGDTTDIKYDTYTVQSGDTLSVIGKKLGINWKEIASLNNIKSPYRIKKGDVLNLPLTEDKVDETVNDKYDMIKPVYYSQKDTKWKSLAYAVDGEKSTIGSAGCGPTTMAMVLASLSSIYIDPLTTCSWSRMKGYKIKASGTSYSYFVPQGKAYGVDVSRVNTSNIYNKPTNTAHDKVLDALKNGNWVIACMGKGLWTSSGHYVLVYGYSEGKVYINDSNSTSSTRSCNSWDTFKSQVKYYWIVNVPDKIKKSGKIMTTGTYTDSEFIREVQYCCGAGIDGKAGPQTLSKTITVSKTKNSRHPVVLALQKKMKKLGYYTGSLDCAAGTLFDKGIKQIQAKELKYSIKSQDGEVTAKGKTWKWFLGLK